jgi:hypothetical protein
MPYRQGTRPSPSSELASLVERISAGMGPCCRAVGQRTDFGVAAGFPERRAQTGPTDCASRALVPRGSLLGGSDRDRLRVELVHAACITRFRRPDRSQNLPAFAIFTPWTWALSTARGRRNVKRPAIMSWLRAGRAPDRQTRPHGCRSHAPGQVIGSSPGLA